MSATWSLTCEETRQKIWIGQGNAEMRTFYTAEPETMACLKAFLNATRGRPLVFRSDLSVHVSDDYAEFSTPKLDAIKAVMDDLRNFRQGANSTDDLLFIAAKKIVDMIQS